MRSGRPRWWLGGANDLAVWRTSEHCSEVRNPRSNDTMKSYRLMMAGTLLSGMLGIASLEAQDELNPELIRQLQRRIEELEKKVRELEARGVGAQPIPGTNAEQKVEAGELVKAPDKERAPATGSREPNVEAKLLPKMRLDQTGFTFTSGDESFKLRMRGYIQADGRFYLDDSGHKFTDTFLLNRVRPVFEGTVFKNFDFKMMPDFGQGRAVIQDAYLDAHFLRWLNLRAGKYKAPVGLERLQSARDLIFVERSLPTAIAPNRDIGVALHGDIVTNLLGYEIGVFNGAPDGASDDSDENDSKDAAGRIFVTPFLRSNLKPLQGLGLGIAGSTGHEDGTAPSYKTVGQQTFFSFAPGVTAEGNRDRISPQGYYYWGPFGLLGEYIVSYEDVSKATLNKRLANSAWQLTASYVLTGEKASFTGVVPQKPFNPAKGQWGALELATRVGGLHVDSDAFHNFGAAAAPNALADRTKSASDAASWGVGVNWYLNSAVKFMLDYDHTHFEGGAAGGNDRKDEHALFSRIQLAF
jgi:phosphate-selective porin OprO/OprP